MRMHLNLKFKLHNGMQVEPNKWSIFFWSISSEGIDQLRWFNNNYFGLIQSGVDSNGSFYNRNRLSIGFIGNGVFTTAITELRTN